MGLFKWRRTQTLIVRNPGPHPLEVMVEITPDRYVLGPGGEMLIEADLNGAPFDITPYEGGLQIYPGRAYDPSVTINGVRVEPDWNTPAPNSN